VNLHFYLSFQKRGNGHVLNVSAKPDQSILVTNSTNTKERQSKTRGQNWQQKRENEKKVCGRSCLFTVAQMFL